MYYDDASKYFIPDKVISDEREDQGQLQKLYESGFGYEAKQRHILRSGQLHCRQRQRFIEQSPGCEILVHQLCNVTSVVGKESVRGGVGVVTTR